jgi:hypothetical protein
MKAMADKISHLQKKLKSKTHPPPVPATNKPPVPATNKAPVPATNKPSASAPVPATNKAPTPLISTATTPFQAGQLSPAIKEEYYFQRKLTVSFTPNMVPIGPFFAGNNNVIFPGMRVTSISSA